jgi:hypothetical protein
MQCNHSLLQKSNIVVKSCRICLTRSGTLNSLDTEATGAGLSWPSRLPPIGRTLAVLGTVLMLGACGMVEQAPVDRDKQVVSQRAQERWELLLKGKPDEAYGYFSPATRTTLTLESFRKRSAGGRWWRSIKMDHVDCQPEVCSVTMVLDYDLFEIKGLKAGIEEKWVKEDGTWWLASTK